METQTANAKVSAHKDVHTIINDKIIELLEKGIVPWRTIYTGAGIPRNIISRKPYRGINILLLCALGYERNFFITEKQLEEIGGSIKPKEKPHIVSNWNYKDKEGNPQSPVLRYYGVYNMAQCVWPLDAIRPEVTTESHTITECQTIIDNVPHLPPIKSKDPLPYYDVLEDYINIPRQKAYKSEEWYFSALFHQIMHSTGHHTRLDRMALVQMAEYGYDGCSQEEVIADMGCSYLQALTGLSCVTESSIAYTLSCIAKLRKDRTFIFTAASLTQKAIDFILNVDFETEEIEQAEVAIAV